jgi:hypothetical protein
MNHSSCPGLAVQQFSWVTPHKKLIVEGLMHAAFLWPWIDSQPCRYGKVKRPFSLNQWTPGAGAKR